MEDLEVAFVIAEYKDIAIAKLGFFDRLLQGHGPEGDRIRRAHDVWLGDGHARGKGMHGDGNGRLGRVGARCPVSWHGRALPRRSMPANRRHLFQLLLLLGLAFDGTDFVPVLDGLGLRGSQRLAEGALHAAGGLRERHQAAGAGGLR